MAKKKTNTTVRSATLNETSRFYKDVNSLDDNAQKNRRLASLTSVTLLNKSIVKVERIEIGNQGWLITFR